MATPGQITEILADCFGVSHQTVVQVDRVLAAAGLRRKGGRGRSSVHMNAEEVARLMITLAAAPISGAFVKEAAFICKAYFEMGVYFDDREPTEFPWFDGDCPIPELAVLNQKHTAGDAIAALVASATSGKLQENLTSDRSGNLNLIARQSVVVEFWGSSPYCKIEINLPGPNRHSGCLEYLEGSFEVHAPRSVLRQHPRIRSSFADLSQIRRFTDLTLIDVGESLRE